MMNTYKRIGEDEKVRELYEEAEQNNIADAYMKRIVYS